MPSVIINEKDYTVFNIYSNNDNIVWIPAFAITGPYDEPVLLNSPTDLVNTFGAYAPAEKYATSATSATYKLATGYEFAMQMLNKGFRVLFQRIVPYTDATLKTVDATKLKSAYTTITDENYEATPFKIKIKERFGGTYGNNLDVIVTMNVNQTKLYLKVIDTLTGTVLEYKEICPAKFKVVSSATTNTIDPAYILKFARGFVNAIDSSKYLELDSATGYSNSISAINTYLKTQISGITGTFTENEDGTLSYSGDDLSSANLQADGTTSVIDVALVNPPSVVSGTGLKSQRRKISLGATSITEKVNVTVDSVSTPTDKIVGISELGKDFTYNEAIDQTYSTIFADTLQAKLEIISDTILWDVKFLTLGNISVGANDLVTTTSQKIGSVMAGLCYRRGDCVAILAPKYGEVASMVMQDFNSEVSGIGGLSASYTSAFAPWGVLALYNGDTRWASPAMIFLSALADSVKSGNPVYLPPAGVNRASVPDVVTTEYRIGSTVLNQWQNKDLPDNINPIMNLNTYGYVIFGQRTLYDVSDTVVGMRSALQELGVRLAVIELKKKIKQVATGLLFEYNNIHTWNEFKSGMYPLMNTMIANGALQSYKIIMDGTTTSPDDIDNNTIRGTIKIIPGRAVEDFIISFELYRSGVNFDEEE